MKRCSIALMAMLPVLCAGCGFVKNIQRNVVYSPLYTLTDQADHHRHEQMAREAFLQMAMNFTDQEFSCDYRRGFVEGFTDYLDFGGVGEPPPIPPPSYRLFGYMTPDGLAAMEDWKNGFRHGAATGRASNLRELVTLPVYWGPVYPKVTPYQPRKKEAEEDPKSAPPKKMEPPKELAPVKPADLPMEPAANK